MTIFFLVSSNQVNYSQMHSATACQTVQNRPRRLPLALAISHWDNTRVTIYPQIQKIAIFFTRIIWKWLIPIYRDLSQDSPYYRDYLWPPFTDRSRLSQTTIYIGTYWDHLGLFQRINPVSLKQSSQGSHKRISIQSYTNLSNPSDVSDPTYLAYPSDL